MKEQSDTPSWWRCDTHGPGTRTAWGCPECVRELRTSLATATRERDEARAALAKFLEWLEKDEAGPQYSMPAGREGPDGEAEWRRWWHGQLDLCAQSLELARKALAATEAKP